MKDKLKQSKINEAYHRKQMEYHQEVIKVLSVKETKSKGDKK